MAVIRRYRWWLMPDACYALERGPAERQAWQFVPASRHGGLRSNQLLTALLPVSSPHSRTAWDNDYKNVGRSRPPTEKTVVITKNGAAPGSSLEVLLLFQSADAATGMGGLFQLRGMAP